MEYLNSANYTYPKIMSRISAAISHWNKYTFLKTNHVYITILFLLQYINFFFMLETSEKWEGRVLAVYPVLYYSKCYWCIYTNNNISKLSHIIHHILYIHLTLSFVDTLLLTYLYICLYGYFNHLYGYFNHLYRYFNTLYGYFNHLYGYFYIKRTEGGKSPSESLYFIWYNKTILII